MKIMKIISICCYCAVLFCSCFKDDGSYTYKDLEINKIDIAFLNPEVVVYYGDSVIFEPILTFYNEKQKEQGDTLLYKWSYHFNDLGCVCRSRNMKMKFTDIKFDKYYEGLVMAEDTTTGAIYSKEIAFTYKSKYLTGWLVLSDEGGKSRLNLLRNQNGSWHTDNNMYEMLHHKELGTSPVALCINRMKRNEVRIMQDGAAGDLILDGTGSYRLIATMNEEFVGGTYPVGFKPKNVVVSSGNVAAIQGTDGRVYTKVFDNTLGNPYAYEYYVNVPLQYGGKVLKVPYLLSIPPSVAYYFNFILYDEVYASFFMLFGSSFYESGKLSRLKAPEDWDLAKGPSPYDLSDFDMIYCQLRNAFFYNQDIAAILKNRQNGKLYLYTFGYSSSSSNVNVKNIKYTEIPGESSSLLQAADRIHMLRKRSYLFFSSKLAPSQLYCYDLRTNRNMVFTSFGGQAVTAIESDYGNDNTLAVGLDNGECYLLDISEQVLVGEKKEKIIYKTKVEGNVVDLFYKKY